jgi:hypothetical protein
MLTPDDESYNMKAHRVMNYAVTAVVLSLSCGYELGRILWKHPIKFDDIFMATGWAFAAFLSGFQARHELKKLVSIIP